MLEVYILGVIITLLIIAPGFGNYVYRNLLSGDNWKAIEGLLFFMFVPLIWPILYIILMYKELY